MRTSDPILVYDMFPSNYFEEIWVPAFFLRTHVPEWTEPTHLANYGLNCFSNSDLSVEKFGSGMKDTAQF